MNKLKLLSAVCLLAANGLASANLIVNGGFESPDISSGWTYGPDPTGGWQGDNIEVWASGFNGVISPEGNQHGELNAHPGDGSDWSIFQTFGTMSGASYDISFQYNARSNDSESFQFSLTDANGSILSDVLSDHTPGSTWNLFSDSFTGTGLDMTLTFTSITPRSGTVGNFIDAVNVSKVPEPSILALMGLGLAGLGFARRRKK